MNRWFSVDLSGAVMSAAWIIKHPGDGGVTFEAGNYDDDQTESGPHCHSHPELGSEFKQ